MALKRILLKYINLLVFVIVIFVIAQNIVYLLKRSIGEEKPGLLELLKIFVFNCNRFKFY